MSERDRERFYWRLCLLLALASPLSVLTTAKAGFHPDFSPLYFTLIGFASIPFAIFVDLLRATLCGEPVRIWVVKPSVNAGRSLAQPFAQARAAVLSRLSECGFRYAPGDAAEPGAEVFKFGKEKSQMLSAFLDHAFFGEMTLSAAESGSAVTCRLTFDDTAILDTGERERLVALCDYLILKSQTFTHESVPMPLFCGLVLSFVTALVTLVPGRVVGDTFLTSLAASAAGMLASSVVFLRKDPAHLFGYRLIAGGMYLASVPFLAKLAGLFL